MANPRETVFSAIVSQLEKIRLDNGYQNDVARVWRVDLEPSQIGEVDGPHLFVLETLAGETLEAEDISLYRARLPIIVAGVIKVGGTDLKESSDQAHKKVNWLINDVLKALTEDPTFGGATYDSVIRNCFVFVDTDRQEGLFNINIVAHYLWARANL